MLPDDLETKVLATIDQGDELLDADRCDAAAEMYRHAISLIPEPKYEQELALAAFTALGEAHFFSGQYQDALVAFREALKCPGGTENPLLYFRFGQAYFEDGDLDRAADALTRAYALDGRAVFEGEDGKYLSFLSTRIDLSGQDAE